MAEKPSSAPLLNCAVLPKNEYQNCTFTSSRLASSASKNSRGLRPLANRLSGNTAMAAL